MGSVIGVFTPAPFVDGWAVLYRIMQANLGALRPDEYLFQPHGAHLHSIVYALTYIDFALGGHQIFLLATAITATIASAFFIVHVLLSFPIERPWLRWLAGITCAFLFTSPQDTEGVVMPFHVVIQASRLTYLWLLWSVAHIVAENSAGLLNRSYLIRLGFACVATTFHGSGHLFAIAFIALHVVARAGWRKIALSVLPLVTALIIQRAYGPRQSEFTAALSVLSVDNLQQAFGLFIGFLLTPILDSWLWKELAWLRLPIAVVVLGMFAWLAVSIGRGLYQQWVRPLSPIASSTPLAVRISRTLVVFSASVLAYYALAGIGAVTIQLVRNPGSPGDLDRLFVPHRYCATAIIGWWLLACWALSGALSRLRQFASAGLLVVSLLVFIGEARTGIAHCRDYRRTHLNLATTALLVGLPPLIPETGMAWSDAYFKAELDALMPYLRRHRRSIFAWVAPLGTTWSEGGSAIRVVTSSPTTQRGYCRVTGPLPRRQTFSLRELVDRNRVVVGYATSIDRGSTFSGYALCDGVGLPDVALANESGPGR
jgi:hypothetical protein